MGESILRIGHALAGGNAGRGGGLTVKKKKKEKQTTEEEDRMCVGIPTDF